MMSPESHAVFDDSWACLLQQRDVWKQLKEAVATGTDAAKLHQMHSDLKAYTYNPKVITHMVQDVCRSVCLDLLV